MNEGSLVPAPPGRLLVFRVGALACAAEVDQVREILPRLPTTRIPGAPPVVAGLVNVRGTLVTVVEGWRALGQDPSPASPTAGPSVPASISEPALGSTIIFEVAKEGNDRKMIGFTVDEVMDMLAAGDTTLEDRKTLPGVDPTLVRAVGRRNGAVFIVLDVAALLGPILTT
ncbi:MAG TPA: chemotaxis protein CheW [Gemmatimonadales bacterium]|nr:chemotaxis protein CheW [Gemmatimonadales bacterium]